MSTPCGKVQDLFIPSFFQLAEYMFLIGWSMVFIIWFYLKTFLKPEKATIPDAIAYTIPGSSLPVISSVMACR